MRSYTLNLLKVDYVVMMCSPVILINIKFVIRN